PAASVAGPCSRNAGPAHAMNACVDARSAINRQAPTVSPVLEERVIIDAELLADRAQPDLVDRADGARRQRQAHEAALLRHPHALFLEVRELALPRPVLRVRHVVGEVNSLSGDVAGTHRESPS